MAELLKTKKIGSEIEELISTAKKYICIFSYSLIVDDLYLNRLKAAGKRGVKIRFVFGVEPKDTKTLTEISEIPGCMVYFKEYLHAKFYYNEECLVISSMNLSEVSERKNYELGVLFSKSKYPEIFDKIITESDEIVKGAKEWKPASNKIKTTAKPVTENLKVKVAKAHKWSGNCIRCQDQITLNKEKPLCYECFQEWAEWENEDYLESFCHKCGKKKEGITFAKPECKPCYKPTVRYA